MVETQKQSAKSGGVTVSSAKRVTYKDQTEKRQKKAQRRQKHTQNAYKTLKRLLDEQGSSSPETIEALEAYVEKCCETAIFLLDMRDFDEADKVLEECSRLLKTEMHSSFPKLLYRVHYRQAELQNAKGLHQESLVFLRQAISMAEEQEAMDGDPLSCMPGETYLNAAIAFQYAERQQDALEAAEKSRQASQRAIQALSEVQQQPKAFQAMSLQEAQNQLMSQLDIKIQSYLVQGQVLEKLNRFEDAFQLIQTGRQLLEQHFGAQHPLISEFTQAAQLVKMQVNPTAIDPLTTVGHQERETASIADLGNIDELLDKRSELMKRGRVKRVFYQQTEEVQSADLRGEFADLEELEDKQVEINQCMQTQSSWMQRQQLMAMRQQQDEQFRMMELILSTQQRNSIQCNHPQVYLPMQYNYQMQLQQPQQIPDDTSSSQSSELTVVDVPSVIIRTPSPEPEPVRTPTPPLDSSFSSKSDSLDNHSEQMGEHRNYLSEDSDSDKEAPPAFIYLDMDAQVIEEPKAVRNAGRDVNFKEKNFKSSIQFVPKAPPSEAPISEGPVITEPGPVVTDRPESQVPSVKPPEQPSDVDKEHVRISTIVYIQSRIRRYLRLVRRKMEDRFGEVCPKFYMKYNDYRFMISIYKVQVAHTKKKRKTQHVRTQVRHRDEMEMHQVEDSKQVVAQSETTNMIIMFQILVECVSHEELGSFQLLLNRVQFPQEFPFLIDYFRQALFFNMEKYKQYNFRVKFKELIWSEQQRIIHEIREMISNINAKRAMEIAMEKETISENLIGDISMAESYSTRIEEFDYDQVRSKLRDYQQDGIDIEALRLKIQHEARLIIEKQSIQSTEVKKIVSRERRKERDEDWRDYIRINDITKSRPSSHLIVHKPSIQAIVKAQSLVRGWLARRNKPKAPKWVFLFDFVVSKEENYYLIRVFRAPDRIFDELQHPFLIVVSRYMNPKDTWQTRLEELPFPLKTCKDDMINSIQIILEKPDGLGEPCIEDVQFDLNSPAPLTPKETPKNKKPTTLKVVQVETQLMKEGGKNEFIDDYVIPSSDTRGIFNIRQFTMLPPYMDQTAKKEKGDKKKDKKEKKEKKEKKDKDKNKDKKKKDKKKKDKKKKKEFKPPILIITFSYQNHSAQTLPYFMIDVEYMPKKGESSFDSIKLKKLPVKLNYMVYFIRQHLRVHFNNEFTGIDYAALSSFDKHEFQKQMQSLADQLKMNAIKKRIQEELAKKVRTVPDGGPIQSQQSSERSEKSTQKLKDLSDRTIVEFELDKHENTYIVRVSREVQWQNKIVPFMIIVFRKDDPSDIDYISLQRLNMIDSELTNYLQEHLRIYLNEQTNLINYACLTKLQELVGPMKKFQSTDGAGRSATITIWKTLLAKTIRKKKITHIKNKKGQKVQEEIKTSAQEEVKKEMIIGYQIEVQNDLIKQNLKEKIVTEIPPFKGEALVAKLREAVVINWNGLYKHKPDSGQDIRVDWIDSITYKRIAAAKPKPSSQFDKTNWSFVADVDVDSDKIRFWQADESPSLDSPFAKIMMHRIQKDGNFDENEVLGQAMLTVEQVFQMFFRNVPDDELLRMDISDVYEKISYSTETQEDWHTLLKYCCSLTPAGDVYIDEFIFQSKRYGFNPAQARTDMKAVNAALVLQRAVRRFIGKVRHQKMYRIPGYAIATGIFRFQCIYLVYMFRAASDQKNFTLTIKERDENHERVPLIQQHKIPESIVEKALQTHSDAQFKLQSIQQLFSTFMTERAQPAFQDSQGGVSETWKTDFVALLEQEF